MRAMGNPNDPEQRQLYENRPTLYENRPTALHSHREAEAEAEVAD
jgi:hypothetical protein